MQALWQQIVAYLVENQAAIVVFGATMITTIFARRYEWFVALGDWGKRIVVFVVAFVVAAVVSAVGGSVSIDIISLIGTGLISGGVATANFAAARSQPTTPQAFEARKYGSRGNTTVKLLSLLVVVGLSLMALASCGPRLAAEAPPSVMLEVTTAADGSKSATATCGDAAWRAATAVNTCEWQVTRNGTAVTVANGFTATATLTGDPGTSATYTFRARGRNPVDSVGAWSAQVQQVLNIGWPPITAPVVTVVVE